VKARRRERLSEFIELRVPTRDRYGRPVPPARRRQWQERLRVFLLNDLGTTGSEEWEVRSTWKGAYDPKTGRSQLWAERSLILKAYCTPAQLQKFRDHGESILYEMARALNQEAVAYAIPDGLEILYVD
jgi:hypothetical protein